MEFDSIFTYILEDIQRKFQVRVVGVKYPVSDIISAISTHKFGNYQSYIHIQISAPWTSVIVCVCVCVMCLCVCVCVCGFHPFMAYHINIDKRTAVNYNKVSLVSSTCATCFDRVDPCSSIYIILRNP